MTAAWREFLRGTAMINRAKDYGLAYPDATEQQTLTALGADPASDNGLYVRTGLFLAAREREDAAAAAVGAPEPLPSWVTAVVLPVPAGPDTIRPGANYFPVQPGEQSAGPAPTGGGRAW